MFKLREGPHTYRVKFNGQGFNVKCEQPDDFETECFVATRVQIAYDEEVSCGTYMPTPAVVEYYVAKRLGIRLRSPRMESVAGRIY
jgi:hypothetical protein